MPKVAFSPEIRREYETLFNTCHITRVREADRLSDRLQANEERYAAVAQEVGAPWFFVGAIHHLECNGAFTRHLHNGDPLGARTVHVPAGRPKGGDPPFTWEQSALDALTLRGVGKWTDWSLAGVLYQLEGYNGWGYRLYHPHVSSPYLWSFSQHYVSGKYIQDGAWSDTAVSAQCGAAVLLRRMAERAQIAFADQPPHDPGAQPLVVGYATRRPIDRATAARVEDLQRWLNTFPGIFVRVDGVPGPRTSDAYKTVTGSHLPGDPRS